MQAAARDDQSDRNRVAMLGHGLAGLEAQTDNSHRAAVGDLLKPERAGRLTDRGPSHVNIIHVTGIEGARRARGTVVVIDVLRSFTVSAYALAGGARECRLVKTVEEARALESETPGALLCAEEDAMHVASIALSNSEPQNGTLDLQARCR